MPVQVKGQVLDNRRVGAYQVLSLTAPGIAELTRPGHFVTLGIGGEEASLLLRPALSMATVLHSSHCSALLAACTTPWFADRQ